MATENTYIQSGGVVALADDLANNDDFDVTATKLGGKGWYDVVTYLVGGSCDVTYLVDSDGDFSNPDGSITVDSFDSQGISEGNQSPIIHGRTAVRITNTSGSAADFVIVVRRRR